MQKPVIAIDFDDVIGDFNGAYHVYHNEVHGTPKITYDDITDYDMTKVYRAEQPVIHERVYDFVANHHHTVKPFAGVVEAIERLSKQYELHLVTSRCQTMAEVTTQWLEKHRINQRFAQRHFTNNFSREFANRQRTKLEVCSDIGAVLLIDDAPAHALEMAGAGMSVWMPHRPWNQGVAHPLIQRYDCLSEVRLPS